MIKSNTTILPEEHIVKKFLDDNEKSIDEWYQLLKYPFSNQGEEYTHFKLKYGGFNTIKSWKELSKMCDEILKNAVKLYRESGET
ncbi:hypothetical protein A4G20_06715 [Pasteurellaceae bacterium RH1A]|nr:hypothetical protein A4G20_06715 [Pasteurellaceae bacterium RH1A]